MCNKTIFETIHRKNVILITSKQKKHFRDITLEFIENATPNINLGIENAKSVTKNGKRYMVNRKNIIVWKNNERLNGEWFLSFMGGKLKKMPEIHSAESKQILL